MILLDIVLQIILAANLQSEPISLENAVQMARENSFSVQTAKANLEKAIQAEKESKSALGPRLTLGATYVRFDREVTASFGQGSPPVVTNPIDQKIASLTLGLPLDISGVFGRFVNARKLTVEASRESLAAALLDVKLATKRTFYQVIQARDRVVVAQQALIQATERAKVADLQEKAGSLAKIDSFRLRVLVDQQKLFLLQALNADRASARAFNQVVNRPVEFVVILSKSETEREIQVISVEDALAKGVQFRPELKALDLQIRALGQITKATEGGLKPSLNLSVEQSQNLDPAGIGARKSSTTGTVAFSFPFFDSGSTKAKVKQARADERLAKIGAEQALYAVKLEIRTAYDSLITAMEAVKTAQTQVDLAKEIVRISNVKQQAGESNYLEIVDAETEFVRAQNAFVDAQFNFLIAYAELERAAVLEGPLIPSALKASQGGTKK